jgi:hypothetical protein
VSSEAVANEKAISSHAKEKLLVWGKYLKDWDKIKII